MPDALILFAHGARDERWREPVDALALRLREALPQADVSVAFLEFMAPELGPAIDAAVQAGHQSIAIAPLFWAQGGHLRRDVPVLLEAARARHPQLSLTMWPVLGESAEVLGAISQAYVTLWRAPD